MSNNKQFKEVNQGYFQFTLSMAEDLKEHPSLLF